MNDLEPKERFLDVGNAILLVTGKIHIILLSIILFVVLGTAYYFVAPANYTSTAQVFIDTRTALFNAQAAINDPAIDSATVESQVEIITSDRNLGRVVGRLELGRKFEERPNNEASPPAVPSPSPSANEDEGLTEAERKALETVNRKIRARRVGSTYIINVTYSSTDPNEAATVANVTVDEYIKGQLQTRLEAANQASSWIQMQLEQLRTRAAGATTNAQEFRAKSRNDIELAPVLEQRVAEANQRLSTARARSEEARTRFADAEALLRGDGARGDRLAPAVREQLLRARQSAEGSAITPDAQVVLERIRSEVKSASLQEETAQRSLDELLRENARVQAILLQARELDGQAQAFREVYDNFLKRSSEAILVGSFPVTGARMASPALSPTHKSNLGLIPLMVLSTIAGTIAGLVFVVCRHFVAHLPKRGSDLHNR
jgi:succinoglycan biosynthesis transport protein ExoP